MISIKGLFVLTNKKTDRYILFIIYLANKLIVGKKNSVDNAQHVILCSLNYRYDANIPKSDNIYYFHNVLITYIPCLRQM